MILKIEFVSINDGSDNTEKSGNIDVTETSSKKACNNIITIKNRTVLRSFGSSIDHI